MKLRNIDMETFLAIFGAEGLKLVEGHVFDLGILNQAIANQIGLGDMQAASLPFLYEGETEPCMSIFINQDSVLADMDLLTRLNTEARQRVFRGYLVHELVHVKQTADGRLTEVDGVSYWEGVAVEITTVVNGAYFNTPWEQEAYVAQFMYLGNCSEQEALEQLQSLINKHAA